MCRRCFARGWRTKLQAIVDDFVRGMAYGASSQHRNGCRSYVGIAVFKLSSPTELCSAVPSRRCDSRGPAQRDLHPHDSGLHTLYTVRAASVKLTREHAAFSRRERLGLHTLASTLSRRDSPKLLVAAVPR